MKRLRPNFEYVHFVFRVIHRHHCPRRVDDRGFVLIRVRALRASRYPFGKEHFVLRGIRRYDCWQLRLYLQLFVSGHSLPPGVITMTTVSAAVIKLSFIELPPRPP